MLLKTAHSTTTKLWLQNNKLKGESPKRTQPPVNGIHRNSFNTEFSRGYVMSPSADYLPIWGLWVWVLMGNFVA